ncbi:MAG: patatin-like phospholipase family protein [Patescibacteria group bacterium]
MGSSPLALIMYGGGMRGAYGAGVIDALAQMGVLSQCTVLCGTSAGAANLAAVVAGIQSSIKDIWTIALPQGKFIKLLRPRWMTDIDYLVDIAVAYHLTNDRVRASATRLFISVTHYMTGATHYFTNHHDILETLRATLSIPVLSRIPVSVQGEPFLDGGISTTPNDLIQKAFSNGATKALVVDISSPLGWLQKIGLLTFMRRRPRGLREAVTRICSEAFPHPIAATDRVYLIRPRETMVTRLNYTAERLADTYQRGKRDTEENAQLKQFLGMTA